MDAYLVQIARQHGGRIVALDGRLATHAIEVAEVTVIGEQP